MYWNILTDTVVCLTGIVHTLENESELFVTNYSKKSNYQHTFYGHTIIVMNILCLGGPEARGQKLSFLFECIFIIIDYCPRFSLIIIN